MSIPNRFIAGNTFGRRVVLKSKAEDLIKLTRKKDRVVSIKLNSKLLKILDETIMEDQDLSSRNEFFERCVLRYLEEKGKL